MPDILIECADCGRRFTWSVGEQHFYRQRGLNRPKRCKTCRDRLKRERESDGQTMAETPPQAAIMDPAQSSIAAQKSRLKALAGSFQQQSTSWWTKPVYRFGLLCLILVGLGAVWLSRSASLGLGLAWLLVINVITLFLYRYDKFIAGGRQMRIPELLLLALAFLGGSPAACLAMYGFKKRHKTQSSGFLLGYWSIVALQITAIFFYLGL